MRKKLYSIIMQLYTSPPIGGITTSISVSVCLPACLFVCLSVGLSVYRMYVPKTTNSNFTKFSVRLTCSRGSVLLWLQFSM